MYSVPPSLNVQPSSAQGTAGTTPAYFVQLVNNDSADCPARNFVMSDVIPSGFSSVFDKSNVTLNPTEEFFQNYYLTSSISTLPGIYSAQLVVTDAADPSSSISHNVSYEVVEPPPACSVQPPMIVIEQ